MRALRPGTHHGENQGFGDGSGSWQSTCWPVLCLALASDVVVVSGATNRDPAHCSNMDLNEQNANVRGFTRNVTKTRERLGCGACGAFEGIVVGEVKGTSSLIALMEGVHSFIIATQGRYWFDLMSPFLQSATIPVMMLLSTWISKGREPAKRSHRGDTRIGGRGPHLCDRSLRVLLWTSSVRASFLFYKLNQKADIISTGITWAIVQSCGLITVVGDQ